MVWPFKRGGWSFSSEKDPRWNCKGRARALAITAGLPPEAQEKLDELEARYGEPPDDLEYFCMKD